MGVGPKPIYVKNLSVNKLKQSIVEAESDVIRQRAQVIGQEVRGERGVDDAMRLIESYGLGYQNRA